MTFMDFVMGWLNGIAPLPLILVVVGLANYSIFSQRIVAPSVLIIGTLTVLTSTIFDKFNYE